MKTFLIFITLLFTTTSFCQDKTEPVQKSIFDKKHEIKLGAVKLIAGEILEFTYEYINSKNFSFGSSVLVNFDNESGYSENFSLTPFARMYFQESQEYGAKGFFVEAFLKYISRKDYYYGNSTNYNTGSYGLSLGKKWINSSGFVFETLIGFGRNTTKATNMPDASFRGDLFIGYRF